MALPRVTQNPGTACRVLSSPTSLRQPPGSAITARRLRPEGPLPGALADGEPAAGPPDPPDPLDTAVPQAASPITAAVATTARLSSCDLVMALNPISRSWSARAGGWTARTASGWTTPGRFRFRPAARRADLALISPHRRRSARVAAGGDRAGGIGDPFRPGPRVQG